MAARRVVGSVDPVAVKLAGPRLGQIAVPDLVGVFGQHDARLLVLPAAIEQAQLDLLGMGREQREIDPLPSQVAPSG